MASHLVTGAAGFIGRSIVAALLKRGETVRGIDNFITGKRSNLVGLEAMEFMEGDLADPACCARACDGVEIVFHEAALASVPQSVADPVATNVACVDATLNQTFAILRELTAYAGDPAYESARAGDVRNSLPDIGLAEELLGYRPAVDFREGLRRTVEWYRALRFEGRVRLDLWFPTLAAMKPQQEWGTRRLWRVSERRPRHRVLCGIVLIVRCGEWKQQGFTPKHCF